MNAPVSIIIPCYRCADTVRRAVRSAAEQTVTPAQILLVNDGGIDGTPDVLRQIQKEYGRDLVEVITLKDNSGPAAARNAAWDKAVGDYIAFLDADDAWHPQKIELQYEWMKARPEAVLSGHLCRVAPGEALPEPLPAEWKALPVSPRELLMSNKFSTPTIMVRRNIPFRFREGQRHSEDYLLWMQILVAGNPAYLLQLPLAFLFKARYGAGGLSSSMWLMEKGELSNYRLLYETKSISLAAWLLLSVHSFGKYLLRHVLPSAPGPGK